jgi:hypothetical protein
MGVFHMNKLREFFDGISRQVWTTIATAVALAAVTIGGLYWARGGSPSGQSVEEKWNVALRQLGVEPVYPPEEDIEVGDVFAIVSSDSIPENGVVDSPLANHAIRLWRLDLSKDVDSNYKNIYVFPRPPLRNQDGAVDKSSGGSDSLLVSSDSVFTLSDHRSDLPIVTFPRFRLTDSRAAKFGFAGNILSSLTGSAEANSGRETEVSITRTQTYGVPYLVAENALVNFCEEVFPPACQDQALRKVLSTRIGPQIFDIVEDKKTKEKQYRMSVEVGLINRVFLTRAIETHLVQNRSTTGRAAVAVGAKPLANESSEAAKFAIVSPNGSAAKPAETEASSSGSDGSGDSGSASEQSELAVSFDGKVLDRPVVFGFESARYHPSSSIPEANPNAKRQSEVGAR